MKLLFENWRKYLSEVEEEYEGPVSLFHKDPTSETDQSIHLYHLGINDKITIIGAITLRKTVKPCIPDTFEAGAVFTDIKYREKGFGSLLYDLAFYAAGQMGYGLTSDHSQYTTAIAKERGPFTKAETDSNFIKRKTPSGNSKFDYTGDETPDDPLDDCDPGQVGPDEMATDHSFTKKVPKEVVALYEEYSDNHEENRLTYQGDLQQDIAELSLKGFQLNYTKS
jgi:hypothetical protein